MRRLEARVVAGDWEPPGEDNLVSVTHGTPAGAFDLRPLGGEVRIRLAAPGDEFTPLGEPAKIAVPREGEVVYAQGARVLTRHWNHRDCEQTKVTSASGDVVFIVERISRSAVADADLGAAEAELVDLVSPHARRVNATILDAGAVTTSL